MDEEIRWTLRLGEQSFELPLGVRMIAGRAPDALIPLPQHDTHASRYHAAFEASFSGVRVTDLGSSNGITVNDEPSPGALLQEGDRVCLGDTVFQVACVYEPRQASLPAGRATQAPARGTRRPNAAKPYVCDVCGLNGPLPASDHEPWWSEVAWICEPCAAERVTDPRSWELPAPPIIGELRLMRFLARGAMAAVYEARHLRGGIRAAVKILLPDRTVGGSARRRFSKEQEIAARLQHERVVRCFAVGETPDGDLYVATEFLSRGDVDALASPRSNAKAVVALVAEMFDALAYAHERGIVHRDVKPANLLLAPPDAAGRAHAKLADFGLAKNFRAIGGKVVTREDDLLGSAGFAAPEQLLGFRDVGPHADVYAGVTSLYYLLTGELPVVLPCPAARATETQICLATLADERVPIAQRRPGLHPWLCEWIDLVCCRDPEKRAHITASDVAATLRAYPA